MRSQPALSRRATEMPASPIRRLAPLAVRARAEGRRVLPLNIGQPDIEAPPAILSRLARFEATNVAYGPSQGLPDMIRTLVRYHAKISIELAPEELFVTTGGSEALLFTFAAIADPGDEILVFEPFYTNYSGFAGLVGVRTVPVTTRPEDGYRLPGRAEIEARITPRTRAIVLCSPNNPTGTVYDDRELGTIADLCRERGLFLVSDEVYREFTYDGRVHRSALTLDGLDEHVIVTDSLSKRVSLCGARIGWIATRNRSVLAAVLKFGQARLCPPTLGQWIALGLDAVPDEYVSEVVAEYQRRRDLVHGALSRMPGVEVQRPEGAFYVCPRLPVDDAERFCVFLLREFALDGETVMLAPAEGFYATPGLGRQEARIAYVLSAADLERSMTILARALESYPGRT